MKVTINETIPIGDYKAIERKATFYAASYFIPAGTSLIYFRTGEYSYRTVAKNEVVSIEK